MKKKRLEISKGGASLFVCHKAQRRSCGLLMLPSGMHKLHRLPNPKSACFIYFLLRKGRVVYIGRAGDIIGRVADHRRNGKKFDDVLYAYVDPTEAGWVEGTCIREFDPSQNVAHRANRRGIL